MSAPPWAGCAQPKRAARPRGPRGRPPQRWSPYASAISVTAAADAVYGPIGLFFRPDGPIVGKNGAVTLRAGPLEHDATLPDGRIVRVRIGLPEDGYIRPKDLETVTLELSADGEHLAALNTILEPAQADEARALLRRVVDGLETGELAPTAHALEPLADTLLT